MTDDLKAALELIKQTCSKHWNWRENCHCAKCPLYFDGGYTQTTHCLMRSHVPGSWDIEEWERQLEADGDSE